MLQKFASTAVAATVALATASTAAAQASGSWHCRTEKMVMCDQNAECTSMESRITVMIDLANQRAFNLAVGTEQRMAHVNAVPNGGFTYSIMQKDGTIANTVVVVGQKLGPYSDNRMFSVLIFGGTKNLIHTGECNPV